MAKLTIETELGTKQFEKQIASLKADLNRYMKTLESDAKVPISLRMSAEERKNLETTIEKTRNQLISLQQQAQRTGEVGEEAGEKSGKGFEKGIKSLKRFSLGLFGIRSAFSIITRASNTYLSQNEETANKLNAIWVALGNALGPIIEIIADGVLKLIGYLNVFLNSLGFNVDLTKNMNKSTKAIKGTTNAMKELNNEVYSFDEINKQSKDTSVGGTSGGASGTNGFVMPELNQDVVKFLQDTAKFLKENWEYLALIGGVIAGFKVAKWLSGLASILGGTGTGLLGIKSALGWLLAIGLIAIEIKLITNFVEEMNNLKQLNKGVEDFYKQNTKEGKKVNAQNLEIAKSYEKSSKEVDNYVNSLKTQLNMSLNVIKAKEKEIEKNGWLGDALDSVSGKREKDNTIMEQETLTIIDVARNLQNLAKENKLTEEQTEIYAQAMSYLNGVYNDNKKIIESLKDPYSGWNKWLDDTTKSMFKELDAVRNVDKAIQISEQVQKGSFSNIWKTAQDTFNKISGLKATPTVEVKADTKKLTSVFDTLASTGLIGSTFASKFSWVSNTLKRIGLAKGGIVNLPGRGVPLTNIVTGEGGHEGFIPMDNEESMDLIGQSVARHVVINLTNNTMLDSRVIAREQVKIQDNQNFITNGRGV